jgi:hypothetical protein
MAVKSTVKLLITLLGDLAGNFTFSTADNTVGSGASEIKTLASGANTITVPTGGATPKGVIIVPPSGNTQTLTLKGVTGDTGVALHATDPSYVSLAATQANFCLTAGGTVTGIRFIWN